MEHDRIAYKVREAAVLAGTCERIIRDNVKTGNLPAVYIGSRVLIMRADLESWLTSKRSATRQIVRPDSAERLAERRAKAAQGAEV